MFVHAQQLANRPAVCNILFAASCPHMPNPKSRTPRLPPNRRELLGEQLVTLPNVVPFGGVEVIQLSSRYKTNATRAGLADMT